MTASEWLRSVARRDTTGSSAFDALDALSYYAHDAAALVVACRRLLEHRGCDAQMWWACSTLLTAVDTGDAAARACEDLRRDSTGDRLAAALPRLDDELVVVIGWSPQIDTALGDRLDLEIAAIRLTHFDPVPKLRHRRSETAIRVVNPSELEFLPVGLWLVDTLALSGSSVLVPSGCRSLLTTQAHDGAVWGVGAVGRVLPDPVMKALMRRCGPEAEVVEPDFFDRLFGPRGAASPGDLARVADCPVAPELLG